MDFVHPVGAVIPGAQGQILAVLAETSAQLNLRTVAQLAGVSIAQASRVLPGLTDLGLVERTEVPPSSLFRLVRTNVASRAILSLATAADSVLAEIGHVAASLPMPPVSVIVFGSFARREAGAASDLDAVLVRPLQVADDDDRWGTSVEQWRRTAREITGNPVEVIEIGADEAPYRLASDQPLWHDVRRDGHVVYGTSLEELVGVRSA